MHTLRSTAFLHEKAVKSSNFRPRRGLAKAKEKKIFPHLASNNQV